MVVCLNFVIFALLDLLTPPQVEPGPRKFRYVQTDDGIISGENFVSIAAPNPELREIIRRGRPKKTSKSPIPQPVPQKLSLALRTPLAMI